MPWRRPPGEILALQALYGLSDEQAEYQVRDRLSFMRFLGLGLLIPAFGDKSHITIGLGRATVKIGIANLAYNVRRLIWLEGRTAPV